MIVDVTKKENNDDIKEFVIGEFNPDEEVLDELKLTNGSPLRVDKIGLIAVSIYEGEGVVPHVHLNGNNFDCCICLHKAVYFSHGSKHQDVFTKQSQRDAFNTWMESINPEYQDTNFKVAKKLWGDLNPKAIISIEDKPDYSKLFGQFNENLKKKLIEEK